jgi:hypothetical protein
MKKRKHEKQHLYLDKIDIFWCGKVLRETYKIVPGNAGDELVSGYLKQWPGLMKRICCFIIQKNGSSLFQEQGSFYQIILFHHYQTIRAAMCSL